MRIAFFLGLFNPKIPFQSLVIMRVKAFSRFNMNVTYIFVTYWLVKLFKLPPVRFVRPYYYYPIHYGKYVLN